MPTRQHTPKLATLLALLALTGCATIERYPRTSAFIATSIALSAGLAIHQDNRDREERTHDVTVPRVDCSKGGCQ